MWTMDNTEGFTQAQLDDINAVLEFAMRHSERDPDNLNDVINNIWCEGMTRDELLIAVSKRLGIN